MLSNMFGDVLDRIKSRVNLEDDQQRSVLLVLRGIRELVDLLIDSLEARPGDEPDDARAEYGS